MPRMAMLTQLTWHVSPCETTDAALLERFVQHRDEAAFAAIVRRHGRAVLGVCRRILGNSTDADDAFQATFLVLAKKAHRVTFHNDVSAWLFAVAMRASRELLRRRTRRANRETLGNVPDVGVTHDFDSEVSHIVLDEVAKLSESYRSAVVLCELDGISRADAAKRLGIPEGTLSSRLAAARKQLAVRLTARGVTLAALAPLGGFVPSALAASVISSDVPSVTVQNLMEVLMRTSGKLMAAKVASAFAVLTMAVVGLTFGEERKPQPIQQAAAKVAVEEKVKSQLILTFREEVRYLTTEGKEIQRIDYTMAKEADAELLSGQFMLGSGIARIERFLPTAGRAGPGGVIPLDSKGLRLMTPGNPPKVKLLDANWDGVRVVGWSADGTHFVTNGAAYHTWWGITENKAFSVNASTGEREQLPFGKDQHTIDVSTDCKSFLTFRHKARALGLPGFLEDGYSICVLNRQGEVVHEHPSNSSRFRFTGYRLSPDGERTLEVANPKQKSDGSSPLLAVTDRSRRDETQTRFVRYPMAGDECDCSAVAWSPDGKQIVSCWTSPNSAKDKQHWHIVVSDAHGDNMRKVASVETKAGEFLRSVDWR